MENQKTFDKIIDGMNQAAYKINSLRYISVIKSTFTALLPVIIVGAFATLFSNMVFDSTNGLAQISALSFLEELKPISMAINYVTMNFLTIFVIFLIGLELGRLNKIKGFFPGVLAVMSYLVVNPTSVDIEIDGVFQTVNNVLSSNYTNTRGLFLGMIIGMASVELYTWLNKQEVLKIKMPNTVPPNVSASFSALIPAFITVTSFGVLGFVVTALTGMTMYEITYNIVQRPLEGVMQGLPGILTLMFVAQVFWIIGIHGNQMVNPIRQPLLLAAIAANTDAFNAGLEAPNIITMPFWDVYMSFGGSGCTLGLLIAIFLIGKRDDMKQIAKLSTPPGIFNINEPVTFGMPIMLNPVLAIPFIITPLITGTIGYFATAVGFAGRTVVMIPWPTPPIISAYLATAGSIGAVITQLVCIVVSILIYLPFVQITNKQEIVIPEAIEQE
jgi:PTS system, lactose/cellobiose family IIC component